MAEPGKRRDGWVDCEMLWCFHIIPAVERCGEIVGYSSTVHEIHKHRLLKAGAKLHILRHPIPSYPTRPSLYFPSIPPFLALLKFS